MSSFFGIGGGVIVVPGLYFLFASAGAHVIIASSHCLIALNASVNVINFYKKGFRAPWSIVLLISIPLVVGIRIGSLIVEHIDGNSIKIIFSIVLLLAALKTLFYKRPDKLSENLNLSTKQKYFLFFFGLLGGVIAGLTGIGGGLILVPLMLSCAVPIKYTPFLSNIGMALATLLITVVNLSKDYHPFTLPFGNLPLSQYSFGYLYPAVPLFLFITATFGRKTGITLSGKIGDKNKRIIFSVLLIIISIRMYLLTSS